MCKVRICYMASIVTLTSYCFTSTVCGYHQELTLATMNICMCGMLFQVKFYPAAIEEEGMDADRVPFGLGSLPLMAKYSNKAISST